MRIWLYFIGKPRDASTNAIAAEFVKRSSRYCTCEMREIQPDRFDPWLKHPSPFQVAAPSQELRDHQVILALPRAAPGLSATDLSVITGP